MVNIRMEIKERFRGCLLGLATGDALGSPVQFMPPGSFVPVEEMIDCIHFNTKAGQWTDDTSMALCLAESLIEKHGFDPLDQMERYLKWLREGHLSSTGYAFDIGGTVMRSLKKFEETHEPDSGPKDPMTAGNGSIMRLAPVPMFFVNDPVRAIEMSAASSSTTHGAKTAIDACRYLGGLIVGALGGVDKDELLSYKYCPAPGTWDKDPLAQEIDEVAAGSFKDKQPPDIEGSGYVVRSLEAALWAFYQSYSFKEGCLLAVNLGDDADTTAAVYGQIAGAYFGVGGIPEVWRSGLSFYDLIVNYADRLYELSNIR